MIKIDRNRKEKGKNIKPSGNWSQKSKDNTLKAIKEGPKHKIIEKIYRDKRVKAALEKLFYDKCAYCESRLSAGDWDVEHFRPKGKVAERPDHPGYYWLTYTWENLYPSCIFCNQRRKDHPRYDDPRTLPAQGKLDQFPLQDETKRAMKPKDNFTKERPLLIDPCNDNPEKHFTYDIHGLIHPGKEEDVFAKETIRICHLNRRRLRDDRLRVILIVSKLMKLIQKTREIENEEILLELKQLLDDFISPSSLFAGAARNSAT